MKKFLALAFACTMLLNAVGCASQEEVTTDASTSTPGTTESAGQAREFEGHTLTLMMQTNDSTSPEAYNAQIAIFEEMYGCTVEVEAVPGGDEGENLVRVRMTTGGLADVYMTPVGSKMTDLDPANNMVDLSGEPWVQNITQSYQDILTYDGGMYGAPSDTAFTGGVMYNARVFQEQGLSVPETWDEMLDVCQKLKDAGIVPVAQPYATVVNTQIPFLSNYYYVQEANPDFADMYTNREIELNESPEFIRGMDKMYDLATYDYLNEDYLATSLDEAARMLAEGEAAMTILRTNLLITINNNNPEYVDDIDFFPIPDVDPDVRGISYWLPIAYVINKDSSEIELAKKWCEFVTTQEAVDAYCTITKPVGAFMINGITLPDDTYAAMASVQEWTDTAGSPVMEYECLIKGANQATICSMVASGDITGIEGVEQIMDDNVIDAQQKGFPGW